VSGTVFRLLTKICVVLVYVSFLVYPRSWSGTSYGTIKDELKTLILLSKPELTVRLSMLTLYQSSKMNSHRFIDRRNFLRAGFLGVGGLTLPWLLQAKAMAAKSGLPNFVKDRSVVLLFLGGGASHIETFNPNSGALEPYRSVTGEVKTSIPGVAFGATFPELAKRAHRMAIVRSMQHGLTDHEQSISMMLTGGTDPDGKRKEGFGMGAAHARVLGNTTTGLPNNIVLTHPHSERQYHKELERVVAGSRSGTLGAMYSPYIPDATNASNKSNGLQLPMDRFVNRRALAKSLDTFEQHLDSTGNMSAFDEYQQQAYEMLMSGKVAKLFDLTQEDPRVVERYDTSSTQIGFKKLEPSLLGNQLLTARRLVEAGAGFVTVQSAGWDMHADANNPNMDVGMKMLGPTVDKALSAFLDDLEQRGMSQRVLTIITGDFGRTPKLNNGGGRDHWPGLCTLALAGGGLSMGQVIGKSGPKNDVPNSEPIGIEHLLGTIFHYLFDIASLRLVQGMPKEILKLTEDTKYIQELF